MVERAVITAVQVSLPKVSHTSDQLTKALGGTRTVRGALGLYKYEPPPPYRRELKETLFISPIEGDDNRWYGIGKRIGGDTSSPPFAGQDASVLRCHSGRLSSPPQYWELQQQAIRTA